MGQQVERAVVYAEREGYRALELDLYRPEPFGDGARPLVVYIHGGGWRVSHRSRAPRETREWATGFFERITGAGFVVAAPDYRLSAEALFPAQLDDVLTAIRWLHDNAGALRVDPARTYLWGFSGGGALSSLAGLVDGAPRVAGVVSVYPVTDLLALDQERADSFEAYLVGGPIAEHVELARAASAVCHVHGGAPPFLLQHGSADTWVPCQQSVSLADALRSVGAPVELEIVPGADHFFQGAADVESIYARALAFLTDLDRAATSARS